MVHAPLVLKARPRRPPVVAWCAPLQATGAASDPKSSAARVYVPCRDRRRPTLVGGDNFDFHIHDSFTFLPSS